MQKLTAIFLLALLSFNWVGYRFALNYLNFSLDRILEADLDAGNYDENELIQMRVPVSLPYQVNWSNYERVDGDIEIDGIHYKFVKKIVRNDSLILLCLPNHNKMMMQEAKTAFFQLVNDLTMNHSGKTEKKSSQIAKSVFSDCIIYSQPLAASPDLSNNKVYSLNQTFPILAPFILAPEKPPSARLSLFKHPLYFL